LQAGFSIGQSNATKPNKKHDDVTNAVHEPESQLDSPQATNPDKDVCFGVTDSLINTFFEQAHSRQYFKTIVNMSRSFLPTKVQEIIEKLLPGQNFTIGQHIETLVAPVLKILPSGANVKARLQMNLGALTKGSKKHDVDVLKVLADVDVSVRMFIEKHSVKGIIFQR